MKEVFIVDDKRDGKYNGEVMQRNTTNERQNRTVLRFTELPLQDTDPRREDKDCYQLIRGRQPLYLVDIIRW